MEISYDWFGLEEAIAELDRRIQIVQFEVDDWQKLGNFLLDYLKSEAQNEGIVVTGTYLASFKIFEISDGYIDIGNDAEHARIVEYGRGPVVPVNATVLHWIDPNTGEDVFSRYSGPVEATHFIEKTIMRGLEEYARRLNTADG